MVGFAVHPDSSPGLALDSDSGPVIAIIPARYQSSRLPGKALADIGGRPMIEHVYRRGGGAPPPSPPLPSPPPPKGPGAGPALLGGAPPARPGPTGGEGRPSGGGA